MRVGSKLAIIQVSPKVLRLSSEAERLSGRLLKLARPLHPLDDLFPMLLQQLPLTLRQGIVCRLAKFSRDIATVLIKVGLATWYQLHFI